MIFLVLAAVVVVGYCLIWVCAMFIAAIAAWGKTPTRDWRLRKVKYDPSDVLPEDRCGDQGAPPLPHHLAGYRRGRRWAFRALRRSR